MACNVLNRRLFTSGALGAVLLATAPLAHAAVAAKAPARASAGAGFTQKAPGVDISGIWQLERKYFVGNVNTGPNIDKRIMHTSDGSLVPMLPWAQKIYDANIETERRGTALVSTQSQCLPHGMPQMDYMAPASIEITQTPDRILLLYEVNRQLREVFMNAPHAEDPDPSWFGDSTGHWEGDTLVIENIAISKKTYIDRLLMPHTDDLKVTERMHLNGPNELEIELTMDDPATFTHPWKMKIAWMRKAAGARVQEFVCDSNHNLIDDKGQMTFGNTDLSEPAHK